ncbi:hypothetical protein EYR40_010803 [Pleurotus pulmonarius]|nr:hypothetical protein EYR40_010803 [Pleurotus pulmonarius]
MYRFNNPFDGWVSDRQQTPSIYGALPYPGGSPNAPSSTLSSFTFTAFKPNIMNCTIMGPDSTPHMYIVTDPAMPTYTLFKNANNQNIALIEWQQHPLVEVRGKLVKQEIRQWLSLSSDRKSRGMRVGGTKYSWSPYGETINLSTPTPHGTQSFVGRISRGRESIILEMSSHAVQSDLHDVSIVATFLLQCGRNID